MTSMIGIARQVALAGATLLAALSTASAGENSYLDTAGGLLITWPHYESGDARTTQMRQESSSYFTTAGEPLITPHTTPRDTASTLNKQRESGYYPNAGAPWVNNANR
jgi:hypothetical protein